MQEKQREAAILGRKSHGFDLTFQFLRWMFCWIVGRARKLIWESTINGPTYQASASWLIDD